MKQYDKLYEFYMKYLHIFTVCLLVCLVGLMYMKGQYKGMEKAQVLCKDIIVTEYANDKVEIDEYGNYRVKDNSNAMGYTDLDNLNFTLQGYRDRWEYYNRKMIIPYWL